MDSGGFCELRLRHFQRLAPGDYSVRKQLHGEFFHTEGNLLIVFDCFF